MNLKSTITRILLRMIGIYDFDREGEKRVLKAIELYHRGGRINRLRAQRLYVKNLEKYGINIYPAIEVGENFHLVHTASMRIGWGVTFGDNCKIYPWAHIMGNLKPETNVDGVFQKATFGNDCVVGAGCAVIGPVCVGDDVLIGAHAIVTKDVPPHSVVMGTNIIRPKRENEIPEKYKNSL